MLRPEGIVELSVAVYQKERIRWMNVEDLRRVEQFGKQIMKKIGEIDDEFSEGMSGSLAGRK
jgi:hypothetical protein